jgi:uncharacterized membrane protein YeaQ/YmgE (transglycosylase-associated protein family)
MSILVAIILGGIVGWIAGKVMGRDEGVFASIVIGVIGAFIGGLISNLLTGSDRSALSFSWAGLFWSLIGAIILVGILNAFSKSHHSTTV